MPETQWMTLLETADIMKRLPIQVTRMCEDGKLEYYMEDGRYFVSRESIDLFMHPRTGGAAPSNTDTNGTLRRKYGRAPDDFEPSSASAAESETVTGRDEADAEEETGSIVEEASGADDENAVAREDVETPETANEPVDVEAREDVETPETANEPADVVAREDVETPETANEPADVVAREDVETPETANEPADVVAQEDEEKSQASAVNPDDPNVRAVEILADLRAAITRHAMEHKAFCDEIAGLTDALESTLSRDGDKTSELTREISSLLARYARR